MGTHCYIGIENSNRVVEYIYVHFDGYFESIAPVLRHYTNREDVEKMINYGHCCQLADLRQLTDEDLRKAKLERDRPQRISSMYKLIEISRSPYVPYIYVFTKENEWLCCYTGGFFQMKNLFSM
jgi:hypothetical protein